MKSRGGHLRLVPRPLVKCRIYPTPRIEGVSLRRNGKDWFLEQVSNGRVYEIRLTTWELRELHQRAGEVLAMENDDV